MSRRRPLPRLSRAALAVFVWLGLPAVAGGPALPADRSGDAPSQTGAVSSPAADPVRGRDSVRASADGVRDADPGTDPVPERSEPDGESAPARPGADRGAAAPPGATPPVDGLAAARATLDEDAFEEALKSARLLAASHPGSAEVQALLGDALYRRGDFEESEAAYRHAIELDPACASGQYGMGRIMRTAGRYGEAAGFFHEAARLDPENAKYIRTLANHLARREDVIAMMEQYLKMTEGVEEERIRDNVSAWIELLKRLGDEPMREVVKAEPTDLPMNVLRGQAYFKADLNKLRGQRFAFDTGATGLTVSPRLAKRAKLEVIKPFRIVGMGGKGTVAGDLVLIRRIALGGIELRNVTATIAEPKGPEEGLIGPPLFSSFRIRIDLKRGTLSLWPRAGEEAAGFPPPGGDPLPFRNVGGQIVVKAGLNGTDLNAMVDTGAGSSLSTFSAESRVPGLEVLPAALTRGRSFGLGGEMARRTVREATLRFAGREFSANGLPSVDLSRFSRALESEIYLVIGFPELEEFILELDYSTNRLWAEAVP